MDIYTVRDGAYPRPARRAPTEYFLLVGDHDAFVNARVRGDRRAFFAEYSVRPDDRGTLCARLVRSSARVRGRFIGVEDFLGAGCPARWANGLPPEPLAAGTDPGETLVRTVLASDGRPGGWRGLVFAQCPPALLPEGATLAGDPVSSPDALLSRPRLALALDADAAVRRAVFANATLRAAANAAVSGRGALLALCERLVPPRAGDVRTALVRASDPEGLRLVRLCHDRNRLRAFALAWFFGQTGDMPEKNEKILRAFAAVSEIL
ncbi:conserved hypothetical pox protein [Squirrelpox virus]|uniref:Conserved hypothetical pox protein n=1 Tax=Squirrelpox virus TaxID=240426 RepID=U3UBA2_9POXV|nr:conserved hypothetical pox protein [Squirrelpox virus]CCD83257.1 conserved hypothetical pox protein [Squirrelpox virus]